MFYQLVVLCCLCVIWRLWSKKQSASDPPELSGKLPIVGHAHRFMGDSAKLYKTLKMVAKEGLQKDGIITISLGPRKFYGIADPEDCLTVSNKFLQKNNVVYHCLKPYFGNGLGTADVSTWKRNRKLLNPAFNKTVLHGFIEVFNMQALRLVDQFAVEIGKPFDHSHLLRINSLETICTTALGVDPSKYSDLRDQYLPRLIELSNIVTERIQKFWLHSDVIFKMSQLKKDQDEQLEHILALSRSIIKDKKTERASTLGTRAKGNSKPFIDLILDLADGDDTGCFTDEHIRAEVDTIIGAGHDTTASLLTFVLTMLGSRDDVQEKAYNELLHVLGKDQRTIRQEDLCKLMYTKAVLKETLRLYPILPVIGRFIDKDVKLRNYTITANNECFISTEGLSRHSIWGPDVDQFRPERWLDKDTLPDPKYFGGFGVGRRSCIGKAYAMMSMKITLAHVLRNYRVSADVTKMVITMDIVTRPESGHYITLSPRNEFLN